MKAADILTRPATKLETKFVEYIFGLIATYRDNKVRPQLTLFNLVVWDLFEKT